MSCYHIVFSRNCICFNRDSFQIPLSEFLTIKDYIQFWTIYVSDYFDILKRHYCEPNTGNRIICCNSITYVFELNNFLKTIKIFEDFIYASNLENNTIRISNFVNSVNIATFIKIFKTYSLNQLDIFQYLLNTDDSLAIHKLEKLLELHLLLLNNFASYQKNDGGPPPEDLLRELEDFIQSSIGIGEA